MSDSRYFGVMRSFSNCVKNDCVIDFSDPTNLEEGKLVGDRIIEAVQYGTDVGVSVSVSYDEDVKDDTDNHEIDILASPNHDFFDIAEHTGHLMESYSASQENESNEEN